MVIRQDQKVDGRHDATDAGIEVKSPSPGGRALSKSAADNRAQDSADSPPEACEAEITRALGIGRVDGQYGEKSHVRTGATNTSESAADDESGNSGGTAAQSRRAHEQRCGTQEELLGGEETKCFRPYERACGRG